MSQITRLACACGQVHIEVQKTPIISTECHCNSCREAAARLQTLPAVPFREDNGGTRFVLYRKDRVHIAKGADRLKEFRLSSQPTTRRAVACCCNTPVFLEFKGGHWLSLYACLWPAGMLPAPDVRTMISDLPRGKVFSDEVPHGKWQTAKFYTMLLGAWVAMGFRSPKMTVDGEIHA